MWILMQLASRVVTSSGESLGTSICSCWQALQVSLNLYTIESVRQPNPGRKQWP